MKHILFPVLLFMILLSCKKDDKEEVVPTKPNCKLLWTSEFSDVKFFYNSDGKPERIENYISGGKNDKIHDVEQLQYDSQGRVVKRNVVYYDKNNQPKTQDQEYEEYTYDPAGNIVGSRFYSTLNSSYSTPQLELRNAYAFKYDNKKRLIEIKDIRYSLFDDTPKDTILTRFEYNEQGNLANVHNLSNGGTPLLVVRYLGYDDKVNPFSLDNYLQFYLVRHEKYDFAYSSNNPIKEDFGNDWVNNYTYEYNSSNLPTVRFEQSLKAEDTYEYECK